MFFDTYKDTVYPIVSEIAAEYGISSNAILKFHKGNKQYPQPTDSQMQFDILDKSISDIRVVLLVQIGKEGWDCKSLTGIILSQEGDCPKNMVLQTSCRCLRQVVKGTPETAMIYLNDTNADKLNAQLLQQHHISLKEFSEANNEKTTIQRYNRMAYLKLPKVDFYQLKINYESLVIEEADIAGSISSATDNSEIAADIIRTTDLTMKELGITVDDSERGNEPASFNAWLYRITKGSFGFVTMEQLRPYTEKLNIIFEKITHTKDGVRYYSSKYNHVLIEANIRKAFCDKCSFSTTEELIPEEANLLNIANFTSTVQTENPEDYYPDVKTVENIILDDNGKLMIKHEIEIAIKALENSGNTEMAETLRKQNSSHPQKNRSFHYLPYRTDSIFEQKFLTEVLGLDDITSLDLEVYYNGDRAMTEFKIKCYKNSGGKWSYVGIYTPDFLIVKRRDGKIHKAIIVETKGDIYKNEPTFKDKRTFMETEFAKKNNEAFGYDRFDYLYLEDTLSDSDRIILTHKRIIEFFKEDEA